MTVHIAALKLSDGAHVLVFQIPSRILSPNAEAHAQLVIERVRASLHKNLRDKPMVLMEGELDSRTTPPVYGPPELRGPVKEAWGRRELNHLKWSRVEVPGP